MRSQLLLQGCLWTGVEYVVHTVLADGLCNGFRVRGQLQRAHAATLTHFSASFRLCCFLFLKPVTNSLHGISSSSQEAAVEQQLLCQGPEGRAAALTYVLSDQILFLLPFVSVSSS